MEEDLQGYIDWITQVFAKSQNRFFFFSKTQNTGRGVSRIRKWRCSKCYKGSSAKSECVNIQIDI